MKEYKNYAPGDLVKVDVWFGRVIEQIQPNMYIVDLVTPDGHKRSEISGDDMSLSYPIEFASNWNGCGGSTTDVLTDNEWNDIKMNHPFIYKNCLKNVAMNTSYGSILPEWIFEFLMSEKNKLQGKPSIVIDKVKNANFGSIMKFMNPGENLNDAIIRLMKEALYITEDNKFVFMSY